MRNIGGELSSQAFTLGTLGHIEDNDNCTDYLALVKDRVRYQSVYLFTDAYLGFGRISLYSLFRNVAEFCQNAACALFNAEYFRSRCVICENAGVRIGDNKALAHILGDKTELFLAPLCVTELFLYRFVLCGKLVRERCKLGIRRFFGIFRIYFIYRLDDAFGNDE